MRLPGGAARLDVQHILCCYVVVNGFLRTSSNMLYPKNQSPPWFFEPQRILANVLVVEAGASKQERQAIKNY